MVWYKLEVVVTYFKFMRRALKLAYKALLADQWPVGAVVVKNGKVIASARNMMEELQDPTAHAEIIAAKRAAQALGQKYLTDCDVYVTLQPCLMCLHTLQAYRVRSVIYGAPNGYVSQPMPSFIDCVCEKESARLLKLHAEKIRSNK